MSISKKVGGEYKTAAGFSVKTGGAWTDVAEGYVKQGSEWVQFWPEKPTGGLAAIVGSIAYWPTTTAPAGWAICDGSTVSAAAYPALAAALGTTWGTSAGNVVLPNMINRFPRQGIAVGSTAAPSVNAAGLTLTLANVTATAQQTTATWSGQVSVDGGGGHCHYFSSGSSGNSLMSQTHQDGYPGLGHINDGSGYSHRTTSGFAAPHYVFGGMAENHWHAHPQKNWDLQSTDWNHSHNVNWSASSAHDHGGSAVPITGNIASAGDDIVEVDAITLVPIICLEVPA